MSKNAGSLDLARQLVLSLRPDTKDADATARRVATQVRAHAGASMRKEWHEVRRTLKELAGVARVRVEDDVADAYDKLVAKLEEHRRRGGTQWDEDLPLQASTIPQHVHFLLELAQPMDDDVREFAAEYLVRPPRAADKSDMRLYREIMAAPFEGEHWGPGYEEASDEEWSDSESDGGSTPSEEDVVTPAKSTRSAAAQTARQAEAARRAEEDARLLLAKLQLRELTGAAYWKTGGDPLPSSDGAYGWRALSSLPALASPALPRHDRAISAAQLQRELLFALSGRPGVLLTFNLNECSVGVYGQGPLTQIVPSHPEVASFSPAALQGILSTFAVYATQAARLRAYVQSPGASETAQAFAAACRGVLHDVTTWVAEREAAFLGSSSQSVSTPLALQREFARFGDVLAALCDLVPLTNSPLALLDALYRATISPVARDIRPQLTDVFARAAAPMWRMTGEWLVQGMPVPESLASQEADLALQDDDTERALPPEFYIQRDRDAAWIDEDFWDAGFVAPAWPAWLREHAVLEGGKARGLLRSLPAEGTHAGEAEAWRSLPDLISADQDIGDALCAFVAPICGRAQSLLAATLARECGLHAHLAAIDGLSLMRACDVLDTWADWLFRQMAARKPWADFHLLTHAMRDAIEGAGAHWINPASVRVRTARRRAAITDIRVDYLVPFPLSQVFTASALELRSDVFGLLLRLMRARKLLRARHKAGADVLRVRHAASWAMDTLWAWINAALDILSARHAAAMAGASFHALVTLELEHGRRLCATCFLHPSTDAAMLHVAGILDAAEAVCVASAGMASTWDTESEGYESEGGRSGWSESGRSGRSATSASEASSESTVRAWDGSLERAAASLGAHVRGLMEVVEGLAGREGDAAAREMWGMLVFALQDWKDVLYVA
ncbi:hypothetical protein CC85DRAFT_326116 [Cutaneotrichosporon oleaginosum]|uniref:Spindle pole body component n=1 Tax=Cutaneotrichosporon oleaginosum TaxID=879819 RepID=A0A0J0XUQ6_9TREE|nr:uncharacterized protein CC85DRAFT_326116 [Cutaneotrichosporon oleaginosum]KLT44836.1 hypothetical protein CC85DRAFT_326116 [Cutaneotrichosporon oleaginosum]TXT11974.1 hypothetical protein COLE_02384 [Cutaneotrichosporon oleaginosum]